MAARTRRDRRHRSEGTADVEGGIEDVKRSLAEIGAKLDGLLAAAADIDVRDTTTGRSPDPESTSAAAAPRPGSALIEDSALIEGSPASPGAALIGDSALIEGSAPIVVSGPAPGSAPNVAPG